MDGFLLAQRITKKYAKTFYAASLFLPKDKRNAAYAVYALCRLSDEAVDGKETSLARRNLESLREKIDSAYGLAPVPDSLLAAFQKTVVACRIPKTYFDELLEGMEMDLTKNRYENFNELYGYCYRAAGVVGSIMLEILGPAGPGAEEHAVRLGIAMQLTNILRDIGEDFDRARIYLPQEEMRRFGVSEDDIAKGRMTENFNKLMQFQIARARSYYKQAQPGISALRDPGSRFVVCAMAEMYAGILEAIEKNDYDVFKERACVTTPGKIWLLLKLFLKNGLR